MPGVPWGGAAEQHVISASDGHRVSGNGEDAAMVNQFLAHLASRAFSPATVRAYAYDLLNFARFPAGRRARLADAVSADLFDYLDWQQRHGGMAVRRVVGLAEAARRGAVHDERRGRGGLRPLLVCGNERGAYATLIPYRRPASPAACERVSWPAGACWHEPAAGRAARASGTPTAWAPRARRRGGVSRGPAHLLGPGDHAGAAAGRAAGPPRCDHCGWPLWTWVRVSGQGGRERVIPADDAFFTEVAAYLSCTRLSRLDRAPGNAVVTELEGSRVAFHNTAAVVGSSPTSPLGRQRSCRLPDVCQSRRPGVAKAAKPVRCRAAP